jgi:hypothetical protein
VYFNIELLRLLGEVIAMERLPCQRKGIVNPYWRRLRPPEQ